MRSGLRVLIIAIFLFGSLISAARADATPAAAITPSPMEVLGNTYQRLAAYKVPPYIVYVNDWRTNYVPGNFASHSTEFCCDPRRFAIRTSDGMTNESIPQISGAPLPLSTIGQVFAGFVPFSRDPSATSPTRASITDVTTLASALLDAQPAYKVHAVGVENVNGHTTYHLQLEPLTDPHKHNLRDLWADTQTWDLRKAHFVVDYSPAEMDPGPHGSQAGVGSPADVTAFFGQAGDSWVVVRLTWTHGIFGDISTYDVGTVDVVFPTTLPDWLFEPVAYASHRRGSEPDYIGVLLSGKSATQGQSGGAQAAPVTTPAPSPSH